MNSLPNNITSRGRMAAYWLTGLGLTFSLALLHGINWRGNADLHTQMEIIATLLAAIVGTMALVRFYSKKNNTFLFIGTGFLGTAFFDGYHALVTSAFFQPFMPSDLPSLIPWSWVASRQFLSVMIFMSWYCWLRPQRLGTDSIISERTVYLLSAIFTLACFLFFAFAPLPAAYYPDIAFHRPEEFGPALFFLVALIGYLKKGQWREDAFEHWLILSLIVGFVGQAMFMSHSGQLFDYEFDIAHLLKKASYICVLTGLLFNMSFIFRQAEESEGLFRGAIESLQEGFSYYGPDDRLRIYNDEFSHLHSNVQDIIRPGLAFEELVRVSVMQGKVVEAIGGENKFIRERMERHRNPKGPSLRERSDGSWYIINEARTPEGGTVVTQTNITELKNAERALREREALTRQILEASPVGVLIVTREGKHLFANERALEIQGVTREQLFSADAEDYYVDSELRKTLKDDLYETGSTPPTEVELLKPDGTHYFVILSSTLTEFEGQQAHLTYLYDITEIKQAEQALRESETRTRTIVDNVIDGIITINERGSIQSVNAAALKIFGYSEDELMGQNVNMLAAEPYRSAHDRYLANYLTTNEPKIIGIGREVEGQRKDGKRFPLDLAVSEVYLDDERMFIGILRDITQRKEMDRIKSEFISTVSHELRTPLTSIRGSLGLITGGAVGKITKKTRDLIDLAEKNTKRLINLVNDILDMEKIESGSMEFQFEIFDIVELVRNETEANRGYAEEYNVDFVMADPRTALKVRGDKDRLMQVLANLLSNAAKFSPPGGSVEIAVTHKDGNVRVSVSDSGPGIPDEFHDNIFDKFTQADSSDTRKVGGTGLGLKISKTIIDKHGGGIGFDTSNDPNEATGTIFYFELPLLQS